MRWIFFNLPTPSSRTMAPGLTHTLTEMSTWNLPGGKGQPARKADFLTAVGFAVVELDNPLNKVCGVLKKIVCSGQ
jgi:hypothetical protein